MHHLTCPLRCLPPCCGEVGVIGRHLRRWLRWKLRTGELRTAHGPQSVPPPVPEGLCAAQTAVYSVLSD